MTSGFSDSKMIVPNSPTDEDRKNPGFERSTKYHNTGFTRASVADI